MNIRKCNREITSKEHLETGTRGGAGQKQGLQRGGRGLQQCHQASEPCELWLRLAYKTRRKPADPHNLARPKHATALLYSSRLHMSGANEYSPTPHSLLPSPTCQVALPAKRRATAAIGSPDLTGRRICFRCFREPARFLDALECVPTFSPTVCGNAWKNEEPP